MHMWFDVLYCVIWNHCWSAPFSCDFQATSCNVPFISIHFSLRNFIYHFTPKVTGCISLFFFLIQKWIQVIPFIGSHQHHGQWTQYSTTTTKYLLIQNEWLSISYAHFTIYKSIACCHYCNCRPCWQRDRRQRLERRQYDENVMYTIVGCVWTHNKYLMLLDVMCCNQMLTDVGHDANRCGTWSCTKWNGFNQTWMACTQMDTMHWPCWQ